MRKVSLFLAITAVVLARAGDAPGARQEPEAPAAHGPTPLPAPTPPAAAQPTRTAIDFARVPDEVLDFFKNTEGRPVRRAYLFDPIFEPAQPARTPAGRAGARAVPIHALPVAPEIHGH